MAVTALSLMMLTSGCTKTDTPSENKPQGNPQDGKVRKDRQLPPPPPEIEMPMPKK
jgi:hypothetical protein